VSCQEILAKSAQFVAMYVPFVDLYIGDDKDFVLIVQGLLDSQAPFMYSPPYGG
jgi:hypothetical protein